MPTLFARIIDPALSWLFEEPNDGGGDPKDPAKKPAAAEPAKEPPAPDPEPEPDPDTVSVPKSTVDDYNRLKREAADRAKADREAERKRAEEEGRHADVVKALEDERDSEKKRADDAEGNLARLEKQLLVNKVAQKLKFRDPADASLHLPDDTPADEAAIERALKTVAKEKDYLIDGQGSRTGGPAGGGDPPAPKDLDDQIKAAEEKGDHREAMRLKNQKLQQAPQPAG